MKRHNPSLAILLACLSTAAALNGCQWDSSEYDLYYNATNNNTYLCSSLCDTTNVADLKTKCENEEIGGTYWNKQCIGLSEESCLKLTDTRDKNNQLANKCSELKDIDSCPYKDRVGIMLNNNVFMFMVTKDLSFQEIYCGTFDDITPKDDKATKTLTLCKDYFENPDNAIFLKGLKYEDSLNLFKESTLSGICPKNTLTCTRLNVLNTSDSTLKTNTWVL